MIGRTAIGMILGLLLLWTQVAPWAVSSQCGQGAAAIHCDGCAEMASCPCATEGDSDPGPPPVPVPPNSLKLPVAKLVDTRVELKGPSAPPTPRVAASRPLTAPRTGYAGVRRSVEFCSFII